MDKNKLTVIACSGSLLAATLFTDPSDAMPLQNFSNSDRQILNGSSPLVNTPLFTEDGISPLNYERRLQQTAISKFGCGCANCVTTIRREVKSGELAL
jgi:hypothetical protein